MTSKDKKSYHWAMRTALRHLFTNTTSSFNQCISCDQENDIYQPLSEIVKNIPCINKDRNRLDKCHVLTQRWDTQVIVTISGKESHAMLKKIFINVIIFFKLPRE